MKLKTPLVLMLVLLIPLLFLSCSTVRDWADVVKDYTYSKVMITTDEGATLMVLRWHPETNTWEEEVAALPSGWYVLPPIPELLGLTGPSIPVVAPTTLKE